MHAQLHPYHLKLHQSLPRSNGTIDHRQSLVLSMTDNNNIVGYGEATPMPEHGGEDYATARNALEKWIGDLPRDIHFSHTNNISDINTLCASLESTPCAQFCAQSACLDYYARSHNTPLKNILHANAADGCHINAFIAGMDCHAQQYQHKYTQGFRYFKYKFGLQNVEDEIIRLHTLFQQCTSDTRLRIDCNGAWSRTEAELFINACTAHSQTHHIGYIDYIEDPCKNLDDLCYLAEKFPQLIAYDVPQKSSSTEKIICDSNIAVCVIKPMLYGSIVELMNFYQDLRAADTRCVFTSFIEGCVGRSCVAHIAAACDHSMREYHGLDTADLLSSDNARGHILWSQPMLHVTDSVTELL